MAFETFDLGRIMQTAEAIKAMKRQEGMDALQQKLYGEQLTSAQRANANAAGIDNLAKSNPNATVSDYVSAGGVQGAAAGTQVLQAQTAELLQRNRKMYTAASEVANSNDPIGTARAVAPEFIQQWDQTHGAGSFAALSPDQVKQLASGLAQHALTGLVDPEKQFQAEQDMILAHYKQQGPGGEAERNAAQLALTQRGQDLGAATTRRGQDMAAQTAEANRATTERGQNIVAATARATRNVNNPNSPQNLDKTWGAYQQAKNGLLKSLAATETGPIAGRIPAMTTEQQTAEGGVSAMAPVLKQIFRVAGEGTFTDKDQELLMKMVPTRTDKPEARQQKFDNIDNIIRAKLGKPVPEARSHINGQDFMKIGGQWYQDDGT